MTPNKGKMLIFSITTSLAFSAWPQTYNFDAPATKPITIKSEAERGYGIARLLDVDPDTPLAVSKKIHEIESVNEQNNTDTDAFQLGLYTGAIIRMSIFVDANVDTESAKALSRPFFDRVEMMRSERHLNMNDEAFDLLFGSWVVEKMRKMR